MGRVQKTPGSRIAIKAAILKRKDAFQEAAVVKMNENSFNPKRKKKYGQQVP